MVAADGSTLEFHCSEQALMWHKAVVMGDLDSAEKIMAEPTARGCKALGRAVEGYDDVLWTAKRADIMVRILVAKFGQNEALREVLLATGERGIAEASPHDRVWGIGIDVATAEAGGKWNGGNLLGKTLKEARAALRRGVDAANIRVLLSGAKTPVERSD